MKKLNLAAAALAALLIGGAAEAQYPVPQVQSIGPNDLFQDVVNGIPQAQSFYASAALLSGTFSSAGANFIIGGDPSTNLFQRTLTPTTAVTGGTGATVVYTADRWASWEALAGSTANSTAIVTTAATLGPGATKSMLFRLTNSQTGTAQVCTAQEIAYRSALQLASHTVEADFNVYAGATYTGTAQNAYIIYGTDASGDNGTANLAFGLNANSVSSTAWAGQTNASTGAFTIGAASTMYRDMVVASIPSTATEVALAICWTPSGTSSGTGGTDGLYLSNIELRKADYLSNWVNSTTAYAVNTSTNQVQATINGTLSNIVVPAFSWREPATEALLQYSYYYQVWELATVNWAQGINGQYEAASTCFANVTFPIVMRATPTLIESAITASTFAVQSSGTTNEAPKALAGSTTSGLGLLGATTQQAALSFITANAVQYNSCSVVSAAGSGWFAFNSEL